MEEKFENQKQTQQKSWLNQQYKFSNQSQNHFSKESSEFFHKGVNNRVQNKNKSGFREKLKQDQTHKFQNHGQWGVHRNFSQNHKFFQQESYFVY